MTDNDAAKALERLRHTISMYDGIDDDYITIRTAITKSAKVDGLLDALKIIEETTNEEIKKRFKCNSLTEKECAGSSRIYSLLVLPRNIARAAIQRFNGEG